jgi:hypothetical protein
MMLWAGGESRAAYDAFRRWSATFSQGRSGWLPGYLLALDLTEARPEASRFRENILNTPTATLAHLYGGYTVLTLQGALSEARAFARAFRPANQAKVAALGPHFERVLQFACGDLSGEDFLRQSQDSQFSLAEAHFLVGLNHLAAGERAQAAAHFAANIETGSGSNLPRLVSKGALHRLRAGQSWPPAMTPSPTSAPDTPPE